MVEAKVIKKIPGYGYFPGDTGSFSSDVVEGLIKGGYVVAVKVEKIEKAKGK